MPEEKKGNLSNIERAHQIALERLAKRIEGFKKDISTAGGTGAGRVLGQGHSTRDASLRRGSTLSIQANVKDHIKFYDQMITACNAMSRDFESILITEARKATKKMDSLAREDTGNLKRSIGFIYGDNSVQFHSQAFNSRKQDYAPMQEFGTRFKRGKPYFRPGIDQFLNNVIQKATKLFNDIRFGKGKNRPKSTR